jgi:exopolysaccharide production protein ExoY
MLKLKRGIDLSAALAGLVLLAPLWLLTALIIRLSSAGPIIYRQVRLGHNGAPFEIWKFRTMQTHANEELSKFLATDPQKRLDWEVRQKLVDDPRLTQVGRILRRYSLDELPQLVNVLRGEMSLVGPRPCLPDQQDFYGEQFALYVQMKPGLTGLWQVSGRNRLSFHERVALDAEYIDNWSLALDLQILLQTVPAVLKADGAF